MPRVLAAAAASTLLASTFLAAAVAAPAEAGPTDGHETHLRYAPPSVDLDHPVRGRAAVRALGDQLSDVARLNDRSAAELRALLLSDRTAWVSTTGRLLYRDPAPASVPDSGPLPKPTVSAADTFALHSKPGSTHTIFLDFDGAAVSGTVWNSDYGVTDATHPAWDPAGDGPSFSSGERGAIEYVWAQVAEDYAAFDVDVTTQDPGQAALDRTDAGDATWGTHALISPSDQPLAAICNDQCGGVAFIGVIDHYAGAQGDPHGHDGYQPAWIFPQMLGDDPKAVAEAATHEVGHTFGLEHDGVNPSPDYYEGHANWAPIMGVAYSRPVSQFSRGDYTNASNPGQDDVAVVRGTVGERSDAGEGTSVADAGPVPTGTAFITSRTDVDVYDIGTCSGNLSVTATPATVSPNLDIQLSILGADGSVLTTADPASGMTDAETATGMGATATLGGAPSAHYFVRVDGVGNGTAATGYTDYGSLGAYTLTAPGGCSAGAPSAPTQVAAHADSGTQITVTWSAPADPGGSAITAYHVSAPGVAPVTTNGSTFSHAFTGLTPNTTYTFTVTAENGAGSGPGASASATTQSEPTEQVPGAPQGLTASWNPTTSRAEVSWQPPTDDGGAPIDHYQVFVDGAVIGTSTDTSVEISGFDPGSYEIGVAAVNAVGAGPVTTVGLVVPSTVTAPGAPGIGKASSGPRGKPLTASISWRAPSSTGGAAIEGYEVRATKVGRGNRTLHSPLLSASQRKATFKMPAGRWKFAVRATNQVGPLRGAGGGWGPWSSWSKTVKAR